MEHVKRLLKHSLVLFVLLVLASCEESAGIGTLRLQLNNVKSKTIGVNANTYIPVKYSLNGVGPGNKSLSLESNSSLIIREGVELGQWTFTAKAYNSDGQVIRMGETSFLLDSSETLQTLNLENLSDTGSVKITFQWNQEVPRANIEVSIESVFESQIIRKTINASEGATSASLSLTDLVPGSYYIRSALLNGDTIVSESVDILVIASNNKTIGTIDLSNSENNSTDSSTVTLVYSDGSKNKAQITTNSDLSLSGENVSFTLNFDKPVALKWFLDGKEINDQNGSIYFTTTSGYHTLNVVAIDNTNLTAGSATWKFQSVISGKPGSVAVETVDSNFSDKTSVFTALGNGRFVVITPSEGKLVLIHPESGKIVKDYEILSTELNWEFLDNTTAVYSALDLDLFVIVDQYCNINVLKYNRTANTITLAYHGKEPLRYLNGGDSPKMTFTDVTAVYVGKGPEPYGDIIASDSGTERSVCYRTEEDTVTFRCSLLDPESHPDIVDFTICETKVFAIARTSSILFCASFDGIGKTSPWTEIKTPLGNLKYLKKLNNSSVIVSDGKTICRYTKAGQSSWVLRGFVNCEIKDLQVSSDGNFIYVLTPDNLIATYRLIGSSIEWQAEKEISVGINRLVINENSILGVTENGSIVICSVIQEEK